MGKDFTIRWLTPQSAKTDASGLLSLIRNLAEFEGWAEYVDIDETEITRRAQLPEPPFQAVLAEAKGDPSRTSSSKPSLVGMAMLFTTNYSYTTRPSLELEMLFVEEDWRSHGVGKAIMEKVTEFAKDGKFREVEMNVLKSNSPAHAFYGRIGGYSKERWQRWGIKI